MLGGGRWAVERQTIWNLRRLVLVLLLLVLRLLTMEGSLLERALMGMWLWTLLLWIWRHGRLLCLLRMLLLLGHALLCHLRVHWPLLLLLLVLTLLLHVGLLRKLRLLRLGC